MVKFWLEHLQASSVSRCSLTQYKGQVRLLGSLLGAPAALTRLFPTNTIILGTGTSTQKFDGGDTHIGGIESMHIKLQKMQVKFTESRSAVLGVQGQVGGEGQGRIQSTGNVCAVFGVQTSFLLLLASWSIQVLKPTKCYL